jgi:ribose transport system substrate-binding protein
MRRPRQAIALGLILGVAVLTGCGSNSQGTASATRQSSTQDQNTAACASGAKQALSGARNIPSLDLPEPVNATALKGKLLVAVPETLSIADDGVWVKGLKAAAKTVGAHVRVIDGHGTPNGETRAIKQAISLHPQVVATYGVVTTNIKSAVAALNKANIPLVSYAPGIPSKAKYTIDNNWPAIGKLEADFALAQTNCKLDAAVFTSSIFTNITVEVKALKKEVAKRCPQCKLRVINVDVSKIATDVKPQTVSAIQRDPNLNFMIAAFDQLATYIIPGIEQVGSDVKVIGNTGTSQNVENVKSGSPQIADIEEVPTPELGWITMDDALRAASGQPAADEWSQLPQLLITQDNVKKAVNYLHNTSYVSAFQSNWKS